MEAVLSMESLLSVLHLPVVPVFVFRVRLVGFCPYDPSIHVGFDSPVYLNYVQFISENGDE